MASYSFSLNHRSITLDSWPDTIKGLLRLHHQLGFNQIPIKQLVKALNHKRNQFNKWQYWMAALIISAPYLYNRNHRYSDLRYINNHLTDYLSYLALHRRKPDIFEINTISSLTNYFIDHELKSVASPLIKLVPHEQKQSWLTNVPTDWINNTIQSYPVSLHSSYLYHHLNEEYLKDRKFQLHHRQKQLSSKQVIDYYEGYYIKEDFYQDALNHVKADHVLNAEYWKQLNREQNFYAASTIELLSSKDLTAYIDSHYSVLPDVSLDKAVITKERINTIKNFLSDPSLFQPKLLTVIQHRYGLYSLKNQPETLNETGKHLNVGRERIRQLQAKALRVLHATRNLHLLFPEHTLPDIVKHQDSVFYPLAAPNGQNLTQFFATTFPSPNPARHDYLFYLNGDCLTDTKYNYQDRHHIVELLNQLN